MLLLFLLFPSICAPNFCCSLRDCPRYSELSMPLDRVLARMSPMPRTLVACSPASFLFAMPFIRNGRGCIVPNAVRCGPLVKVPSQKSAFWGRTKNATSEDLPPEEFLSKEVDPILEKISAHGIQSLTDRERRILEAAREKMAKR